MAPSLATKILSPITLLAGTFLLGVLPIPVQKTLLNCGCNSTECKPSCRARKGKVIANFLIYLGGGVLLGTCLVHLLPEAREGFEKYYETQEKNELKTYHPEQKNESVRVEDPDDGDHEHFSMPEFVVCCGFFAVYLVEEIIHSFIGHHHPIPTETRAIRSFSRSNSCHSGSFSGDPSALAAAASFQRSKEEGDVCATATVTTDGSFSDVGFSAASLLTVAALSFHSLFEGFAIGLQPSDSKLWLLFAAVSVHKFVIAFVVGLEVLASGGHAKLVYIYMSIFASMSPLGMIIAMITQSQVGEGAPLTVGVLNGIATGTLLYVTFCEILQREEEDQHLTGWQKYIATISGFTITCIVQYLNTLV